MMINVVDCLSETQVEQLHQLYQQEWWTKDRTLVETQQVIDGSSLIIALVKDNQLIAFARVLTDYIFKAFMFDVIVAKDYRGQGLGNKLMALIRKHEKLKKVKTFELYCLPEMVPFYESHEFSTHVGEIKLMRLALHE